MGVFSFLKKEKVKPILTADDQDELRELERTAYMEEARKKVVERGKQKAEQELKFKKDLYN